MLRNAAHATVLLENFFLEVGGTLSRLLVLIRLGNAALKTIRQVSLPLILAGVFMS